MVEKFKYGQFSLTPEEKEKAEKEGTLEEKEAQMKKATEALRLGQQEEAIKELEKSMEGEKDDVENAA